MNDDFVIKLYLINLVLKMICHLFDAFEFKNNHQVFIILSDVPYFRIFLNYYFRQA